MQTLALPDEALRALCRKYRIQELALFGSALGPAFRPDSDVDFLVEFQPDAHAGFLLLASLQEELEKLLGRRVDVVPKAGLKPLIRNETLASALVLYVA